MGSLIEEYLKKRMLNEQLSANPCLALTAMPSSIFGVGLLMQEGPERLDC